MKKTLNFVKSNLLLITLILQPFLDILAYAQNKSSLSFAGAFRLAITVAIPFYTLFFTKKRKKFILAMSIIGVFSCLHVLNGFRVGYASIVADVRYLLLVLHAILLAFSFMFLYEKEEIEKQIKTALKIVVPSIAITYYLSYFLKSGNYTYVDDQIGWTGWNNTPSVFSIITSAVFPFSVYFCINTKKKWLAIFLIPLSFMCILNGTKAAYLTLIFTLLGFSAFVVVNYFVHKKEKFPFFTLTVLVALLFSSVIFYNVSPRSNVDALINENLIQSESDLSEEISNSAKPNDKGSANPYYKFLDQKMVARFGAKRVLAAYGEKPSAEDFANNRLRKIIFGSLVWQETDSITKFVGFEQDLMCIGDETFDLESDFPAILFYYGYIGFALFIGLILYFWVRLFKQLLCHFKESFNLFNFTIFINYGLLMLSAAFTGHLLRRPNSAIYLAVAILLIYCKTTPLFTNKKEGKKSNNEEKKCN